MKTITLKQVKQNLKTPVASPQTTLANWATNAGKRMLTVMQLGLFYRGRTPMEAILDNEETDKWIDLRYFAN